MKSVLCQSQSDGATRALGHKLAVALRGGGTIFLEGDLGAGKTTFVQGMAEGLGIEDRVTSPTFTLMSVYETKNHEHIDRLVHVDLYRISYMEHVANLDLPGYQKDPRTLLVVEWPERLPAMWGDVLGSVEFESKEFNTRSLTFSGSLALLIEG